MNKTESLIELIFDEMGANNSMIFRIQPSKQDLVKHEEVFSKIATKIEEYNHKIAADIQQHLSSHLKKIDDFKAMDRKALSDFIITRVKIYSNEVSQLFSENSFSDIKTFSNGLTQFNQRLNYALTDLNKIEFSQVFDGVELQRKMEMVYSCVRTLAKVILSRIKSYKDFKNFLSQEVFLFCQVSMSDKDLTNFDVAYSYDKIDTDNFSFLNAEVYRIIKNKVIPEFKLELDNLKSEYENFYSEIIKNDISFFLNQNEVISLKKEKLLKNDFMYFNLSTSYYLELINKFKEADKKIYKRLFQVNRILARLQVLNSKMNRPLSESELLVLIFSKLIKLNFVSFMMMSDEEYEETLIGQSSKIFQSEIPYGQIISGLVIPYKLFKLIKKDQSLKIWDLWRHEFVIKNYQGKTDDSKRFVLTGREINRKNEVLQEAIFIHLQEEQISNFKENSRQIVLDRSSSVVVQNNMPVDTTVANSFKISVQFSFILENSIIAAKNMKFN